MLGKSLIVVFGVLSNIDSFLIENIYLKILKEFFMISMIFD